MFLKRKSTKFLPKHNQIILKFNFGNYAQKHLDLVYFLCKNLPPSDEKKGAMNCAKDFWGQK